MQKCSDTSRRTLRRRRARRDGFAQDADEVGHLVAEQGDQDIVLVLVEVDGAAAYRLAGYVGDAGVVVPLAGKDPHCGFDDLLRLVGVTHGG
jgi:hypothetical protein